MIASGISPQVLIMSIRLSIARAAKQDAIDSRDAIRIDSVTVCMVEPQIVDHTRDVADIRGIHAGLADKRPPNSFELTQLPQLNAQV